MVIDKILQQMFVVLML